MRLLPFCLSFFRSLAAKPLYIWYWGKLQFCALSHNNNIKKCIGLVADLSNCAILTKWIENNLVNGDLSIMYNVDVIHNVCFVCVCFSVLEILKTVIRKQRRSRSLDFSWTHRECAASPSIIAADKGINQVACISAVCLLMLCLFHILNKLQRKKVHIFSRHIYSTCKNAVCLSVVRSVFSVRPT